MTPLTHPGKNRPGGQREQGHGVVLHDPVQIPNSDHYI